MSETVVGAGKRRAMASLLADPRYEVIPLRGVLEQAATLPAGATVTVTASPSRGTAATVELVESLARQGFQPVPHLAARTMRDRVELAETLDRLADAGVRDVFVVGGDAPEPAGEFADGLELLRAIEESGRRPDRLGVPSYPDGHHRIDRETLWSSLAAKQAHADYTVTQLCFDPDAVCRFAAEARRRGIALPIVAGVPGIVEIRKLLRISVKLGVGDSVRFLRGNRAVAGKLLLPGGFRPQGLVRKLGASVRDGRCDLARLHVYTFNHIEATVRWLTNAQHRAAA